MSHIRPKGYREKRRREETNKVVHGAIISDYRALPSAAAVGAAQPLSPPPLSPLAGAVAVLLAISPLRQHTGTGPRPGNKSNGSPHPSPKKDKDLQGLCKAVPAVAGRFGHAPRALPLEGRCGPSFGGLGQIA